jgi:transposase
MRRGRPARSIALDKKTRSELERLANSSAKPYRIVLRARIILVVADGLGNRETSRILGIDERTVCKWRGRFARDPRVKTLDDAHRSGRPSKVKLTTRLHLVKLACARPKDSKAPFREVWTQQTLADALFADTGVRLSRTEVRRILKYEGLRPHRVRQWLHSPDPDFEEKAKRICELYLNPPEDSVVLCIDEKPMQVLSRKNPTHVGGNANVRYEYEYKRHGTRTLLASFDILDGFVFGRAFPDRTAETLVGFMHEVAYCYPDQEVFVVWDNLNIHFDGPDKRWTQFNVKHGERFHFVYTPIHASWLNQVEIWFSIIERRVLRYGSFNSPRQLEEAVHGFIHHWNQHEAHPFRWTFRGRFGQNRHQCAA